MADVIAACGAHPGVVLGFYVWSLLLVSIIVTARRDRAKPAADTSRRWREQ
jgi:hypothetical protein